MRKVCALVLWVWVVMVAGGGCSGADDPPLTACERKARACQNSCFKAGAGSACFRCCTDNSAACSSDAGSYSFYSCPDKED